MKFIYYTIVLLFPVPLYEYVMGTTPLVSFLSSLYLYGTLVLQLLSIMAQTLIVVTWDKWTENAERTERVFSALEKRKSIGNILLSLIPVFNSVIFYQMGNHIGMAMLFFAILDYCAGYQLIKKKDGK